MTNDQFDLTERERIRWALIDYMKAHKIGVPTLAARIKASHPREMEIPWKTLQRFLRGKRTHDMALIICKAFAEQLPNKPMAFQALGEALYSIYGTKPNIPTGVYTVRADDIAISEITITAPVDRTFRLVKEATVSADRHVYDGVTVSDGSTCLTFLKDRHMHTARVHVLNLRREQDLGGIIYDNGNLVSGNIRYRSPLSAFMITRPHDQPTAQRNLMPPLLETIRINGAKNLQLSPFLESVWLGGIVDVRAYLKDNAALVTEVDPRTHMNALHLAVGRDDLEMTKLLVEAGIKFIADGAGRMPSVIAVQMEVSEELADYIYEAEIHALQAQGQEDV